MNELVFFHNTIFNETKIFHKLEMLKIKCFKKVVVKNLVEISTHFYLIVFCC